MKEQRKEKMVLMEGKKPIKGKVEVKSSVLEKGERNGTTTDNKT